MIENLIGETVKFDFGELKVRFTFDSTEQATFVVENGAGMTKDGHTETVDIVLEEIRPSVFMVSWREATGATVTHIEDYANGVVHSNVTLDGKLYNLVGKIEGAAVKSQKDIVRTAMHELFEAKDVAAVDRYWKEPYPQHNPQMPSGLDGLRQAAPGLEGFSWKPSRMVEEGDLVMAHSRVLGWAEDPMVIVDIFRLEDGKIVEHWDVMQKEVPAEETVSGNPMV